VLRLLDEKWPKVAEIVLWAEDDVLAYFSFPEAHRRQIRSTNPLERLSKELRWSTRVIGTFPNEKSVLPLVGMLLVEQHEEWTSSDRRSFSAGSMKLLLDNAQRPLELEDRTVAAK